MQAGQGQHVLVDRGNHVAFLVEDAEHVVALHVRQPHHLPAAGGASLGHPINQVPVAGGLAVLLAVGLVLGPHAIAEGHPIAEDQHGVVVGEGVADLADGVLEQGLRIAVATEVGPIIWSPFSLKLASRSGPVEIHLGVN